MTRLCAVCVLAASSQAARVVYHDGQHSHLLNERYNDFAELAQRIIAGDHPDYPPGGWFEINTVRTKIEAVTAIDGTEVCVPHVQDLWQRQTGPRGARLPW